MEVFTRTQVNTTLFTDDEREVRKSYTFATEQINVY